MNPGAHYRHGNKGENMEAIGSSGACRRLGAKSGGGDDDITAIKPIKKDCQTSLSPTVFFCFLYLFAVSDQQGVDRRASLRESTNERQKRLKTSMCVSVCAGYRGGRSERYWSLATVGNQIPMTHSLSLSLVLTPAQVVGCGVVEESDNVCHHTLLPRSII